MTERSVLPIVATLCVLAASCSSAQKRDETTDGEAQTVPGVIAATNEPAPIGKVLADVDGQIRAWNNLLLTAGTAEERRKARGLEDSLSMITHKRRAEIIEQLESGPLANRVIAASALGFTRDVEAQSPLIAALDDSHPDVVGNALLGLMLLGRQDTPLDSICRLMQSSSDEGVRRNAAQCAASLVNAGAQADCVLPAARQGLSDDDAGVRSQCILLLGSLVDTTSLPTLCDHLSDPIPLVASAAARAVAYIGSKSPPDKGLAARALASAYAQSEEAAELAYLRRALVQLSGKDRGEDPIEWGKWAQRLP